MSDLALANVDGKYRLPVANCPVTRCYIDYAATLLIAHELGSFELRIENDFTFIAANGAEVEMSPQDRPAGLGPMLPVVRTSVEEAIASDDGSLTVLFADGSRLRVPPSPEYEAWELAGPGGLRVISTPGGELAIWSYQP